MKIYISLPISGRKLSEAKEEAGKILQLLTMTGHEGVSPFKVAPEEGKPYSYYMGRDIEALLECDGIYLAPGWGDSKGCIIEHCAAEVCGLEIFDGIIPPSPLEKAKEIYSEAREVLDADEHNHIAKTIMVMLEKVFGKRVKRF